MSVIGKTEQLAKAYASAQSSFEVAANAHAAALELSGFVQQLVDGEFKETACMSEHFDKLLELSRENFRTTMVAAIFARRAAYYAGKQVDAEVREATCLMEHKDLKDRVSQVHSKPEPEVARQAGDESSQAEEAEEAMFFELLDVFEKAARDPENEHAAAMNCGASQS